MNKEKNKIFTIGHSNHSIEKFLELLKQHKIEVVADVRSAPYSKYSSHFNKDLLKTVLLGNGIKYLFLGAELGARPGDQTAYQNGRVCFEKLRVTPLFQNGIERLLTGICNFRIALMCSEKDPASCHRTILISRTLSDKGVDIRHILEDGNIINQHEIENQLMTRFNIQPDLFEVNRNTLVKEAYRLQEEQIAHEADEHKEHENG